MQLGLRSTLTLRLVSENRSDQVSKCVLNTYSKRSKIGPLTKVLHTSYQGRNWGGVFWVFEHPRNFREKLDTQQIYC